MNTKFLSYCLTFCLTLLFSSLMAATPTIFPKNNKPKINLIYRHSGAGLARDAVILTDELRKLGYSVKEYKVNMTNPIREADINIFLEEVQEYFFTFANKNYFIPNAEWYKASMWYIPDFDMIICKTREAERIFKPLNSNTVYMGFTSLDRFQKNVDKDFRLAIHFAGKSPTKGTDAVVEAWEKNPHFPGLFLFRYLGRTDFPPLFNMRLFKKFIDEKDLLTYQNQFGIHLCPSETEGFGHYLMEALSCGAVVVTTDAPPMNEFVLDKRCLAGYNRSEPQFLAINYYVDPEKLSEVINNLMVLSDEELRDIGTKNREFYLQSKKEFQQRIATIFDPALLTNVEDEINEE